MIPRFFRSTPPAVAHRQAAGVGERALAATGAEMAQLGGAMVAYGRQQEYRSEALAANRGFRELQEWHYGYLRQLNERRQELAATSIDPETGGGQTGYEQETKGWPAQMQAQYDRVKGTLAPRAAQMLEERYNQYAPHWSNQAVEVLDHMEMEDVTKEITDLAGQDRVADAAELLDLYQDRYSPGDYQRIGKAIATAGLEARRAGVEKYLQDVARTSSWQAAGQLLDDADFQRTWGLDISEAGDLKTDLDKFVKEQAGLQDKARQREREEAANAWIVAADKGEANIAQGRQAVLAGTLDRAVYEEGKRILLNPPTRNDPAVFEQLLELQDAAVRDPAQAGGLKTFVRAHASQLTPETRESALKLAAGQYNGQMQALNEEVQQAGRELVTVTDESLQVLQGLANPALMQNAENQRANQYRQVDYVRRSLMDYVRDNPKATPDDLYVQRLRLLRGLQRQSSDQVKSLLKAYEAGKLGLAAGPGGERVEAAQPWGEVMIPALPAPGGVPKGLESVWDSLTPQRQAKALELLRLGRSPEEIVRRLGAGQ